MHATHLQCPQCRAAQPIQFEPLLPGESSLGTRIACARCGRHAFTLIRPARFYCEICDEVQPGVLEPVDMQCGAALGGAFAVLLVCAGCFDGKALLYAAATPNRCADAAASGPTAPGPRADRVRRG